MKWILVLIAVILSSCSPIETNDDYQTKYPDTPTMQSAEDASTGKLFKD